MNFRDEISSKPPQSEKGYKRAVMQRLCIGSPEGRKRKAMNPACLSPTKPLKFPAMANVQGQGCVHPQDVRKSVKWNRKQGVQLGFPSNLAQTIIADNLLKEVPKPINIAHEKHQPRPRIVKFNIEKIRYGQLSRTFQQGELQNQQLHSPPKKYRDTFAEFPNSQNFDPNNDFCGDIVF